MFQNLTTAVVCALILLAICLIATSVQLSADWRQNRKDAETAEMQKRINKVLQQ